MTAHMKMDTINKGLDVLPVLNTVWVSYRWEWGDNSVTGIDATWWQWAEECRSRHVKQILNIDKIELDQSIEIVADHENGLINFADVAIARDILA